MIVWTTDPLCFCVRGELAFSEIGFSDAKGARIEGRGVIPDISIERKRSDLLEQRDRALEAAQAQSLK